MENFGRRLKRLREERSLTVKEIAAHVGVAPSTFRDWEYGRSIKGEPYVKIAQALGVSVYELLTGQAPSLKQSLEKIRLIEAACKDLQKELGSFL